MISCERHACRRSNELLLRDAVSDSWLLRQVLQNEPDAPWTLHAFSRLGGEGRPEQKAAAALAKLDAAIRSDEPSEAKLEHLLDVLQNEPDGPWTLNAFSRLGGSGSPAQKAALAKLDAAMKSAEPADKKLDALLEVRTRRHMPYSSTHMRVARPIRHSIEQVSTWVCACESTM